MERRTICQHGYLEECVDGCRIVKVDPDYYVNECNLLRTAIATRDARIAELERLLRHVYGSVGCGCNPCRSCKEVSARIDAALAAAKGE